MTEAEWLVSDNAQEMLEALRLPVPDYVVWLERKLQLYYLACCGAIWKLLPHEGSRMAVEAGERYVEGEATDEELDPYYESEGAAFMFDYNGQPELVQRYVQETKAIPEAELRLMIHPPEALLGIETQELLKRAAYFAHFSLIYPLIEPKGLLPWANSVLFLSPSLLRDIIGNPFRVMHVVPSVLSWNDGCVVKLATAIHEKRAFNRMPILGDALEDAGCDNADILAHCQSAEPHVKGCWVVDLLLGKE